MSEVLRAVTDADLTTLASTMNERARDHEVIVVTFGPDKNYANYITRQFAATVRTDEPAIDVMGYDNRHRGDVEFWTPLLVGDSKFAVHPEAIDISGLGVQRLYFMPLDESRPHPLMLARVNAQAYGDLLVHMAKERDVVVVQSEPGARDVAYPLATKSFVVTVDEDGIEVNGDYVLPGSGNWTYRFAMGCDVAVRPNHSIDICNEDGVFSFRFPNPI